MLDKRYGAKRSKFVKKRAVQGNKAHQYAHREAVQQASRSPCFIASCIYGVDADQTNALRDFRDTHLESSWWGRAFVRTYYRLSPSCVPTLERCRVLNKLVRAILDFIIKRITVRG